MEEDVATLRIADWFPRQDLGYLYFDLEMDVVRTLIGPVAWTVIPLSAFLVNLRDLFTKNLLVDIH